MADLDHTLEPLSAQENSFEIIYLEVQEVFAPAPLGLASHSMSDNPPRHEPSIVLQGEWLRKVGFKNGQIIRVIAEPDLLQVTQRFGRAYASGMEMGDEDDILSFDDLKDEKGEVKTENDDKKIDDGGERNGDSQGSENGYRPVMRQGSGEEQLNEGCNGMSSGEKSNVLADVNGGVDRG